ncbi:MULTISPECIES: UDP-3-O-(3-hydroxymyristoyl)glucosamine N-acyltransferase [Xanthomarina]|jgi:UDP-3-O-[3-hydroxymyristoyl] glucosamine N-acyltransferase|uniref:UDP-3-O-acylglucosamine N-acyltransferase n=1 Tax=Xanthomarina gelatinilytica TaxID=1137281 RepID=M7MFQ8_9FLAO|nr:MULTISPECIES: UDP-3-O-(3-hydroxymyristoyl)glucosamine N-acyltransferase [Xanthomarina]MCB0388075.1 UDP-3-O-(3-hydroxymyristoyl)glucosamine N-acyltransferase [Winogradskyella sp.]EMQ95072.1 UDP-3-O-[3-hydroxymyristoyl] glucosamine N-acyltransferase [Xanthomarina gelatinilytica]MAL23383.1 UDP-3-O-(3-hydroxymyristoyl)glucosamine N-acyltransferase [Xanthomarina sp.]MBF60562.1 UDP-3-O-(3-hydroxymyristoyl)glucosamine N-acyltransferase [Xanthomarina sp.]MDX1317581.1 UDP-3-O-(3-hydroxymyristoyl)glu
MKFTAQQIAGILEGDIVGNPDVEVSKLSKIEEGTKGSLTFLANPKYQSYIYSTKASITIVNKTFVPENHLETTLIKVEDAYKSFSKLLEYYNMVKLNKQGIENPSFISDSATYGSQIYVGAFTYIGENVKIGNNVKIFPNCYIGDNVVIGNDTVVFAGVKIYSETSIGNNCVINSGVIIGADGFGFVPNEKGEYNKVPQTGNVIIEDFVDIGAATTIDRATLGSTIIRRGVKLDNQIQIAHNVEIGKNTVIAAQTGIAGSTKIGENCQIGGQVGFAGHITIGNNVKIQAQSGIGRSIKDNETLQGSPAFSYGDWNKSYVYFKNLPKIVKNITDLEKKVDGNN